MGENEREDRYVKKWIITGVLLLALGASACSAGQDAAIVNGEAISMEDLEAEVVSFQESIANSGLTLGNPEDEEYQRILKEEVLNIMIRKTLLKQALAANDIEISEDNAREYLDNMKTMYGEEQYQAILDMNGVTEEIFIEDFSFNEALNALRDIVTADVAVDEEEAREYFEANKSSFVKGTASHILIKFNPAEATDEIKEEMQARFDAAMARLDAGEAFAEVAKDVSDDGSASEGGKLGASFTMLDSPFVDVFTVAALSLDEGEYTREPVVSQFGYHIIRLDEKVEDFETLKFDVVLALAESQKDEVFGEYVLQLSEDAEIENFVVVEDDEEVEEESQDEEA